MLGLNLLTWCFIIGAVLVLLEVALFWAASALADAPSISAGKTFLVSLLATAAWAAAAAAAVHFHGGLSSAPFAPDNRNTTLTLAGIALGISWVVPAVLYVPLLSVSVPRSLLLSLYQMLLRGFLYTLIVAITMVVLASLQIYIGTEIRAELLLAPQVLMLR